MASFHFYGIHSRTNEFLAHISQFNAVAGNGSSLMRMPHKRWLRIRLVSMINWMCWATLTNRFCFSSTAWVLLSVTAPSGCWENSKNYFQLPTPGKCRYYRAEIRNGFHNLFSVNYRPIMDIAPWKAPLFIGRLKKIAWLSIRLSACPVEMEPFLCSWPVERVPMVGTFPAHQLRCSFAPWRRRYFPSEWKMICIMGERVVLRLSEERFSVLLLLHPPE